MTIRPTACVLAGPSEDPQSLIPTPPNPPAAGAGGGPPPPTRISPTTRVRIHIRDFAGQPRPLSASTEYFSHASHAADLFSIQFFFTPPEVTASRRPPPHVGRDVD